MLVVVKWHDRSYCTTFCCSYRRRDVHRKNEPATLCSDLSCHYTICYRSKRRTPYLPFLIVIVRVAAVFAVNVVKTLTVPGAAPPPEIHYITSPEAAAAGGAGGGTPSEADAGEATPS